MWLQLSRSDLARQHCSLTPCCISILFEVTIQWWDKRAIGCVSQSDARGIRVPNAALPRPRWRHASWAPAYLPRVAPFVKEGRDQSLFIRDYWTTWTLQRPHFESPVTTLNLFCDNWTYVVNSFTLCVWHLTFMDWNYSPSCISWFAISVFFSFFSF
jgi:hypothetical protein